MAAARFELYVPAHSAGRGRRLPDAPVAWRLLTGNNRDLGRCATTYPDVAACVAALARLRAGLAEPTVVVSSPDGRNRWVWRIVFGGAQPEPGVAGGEQPLRVPDARDAAVSSRVYQRRVQAEAACGVFVRLAADAPVSSAVRLAGAGPAAR